MPKVKPGPDAEDTDLDYPQGREDVATCLKRCEDHLQGCPSPIDRAWLVPKATKTQQQEVTDAANPSGQKIRVLQWNVLSQGELESSIFCNRESNFISVCLGSSGHGQRQLCSLPNVSPELEAEKVQDAGGDCPTRR